MKWFEKHTTDRNSLDSRQIKRKFGIAGYGIYESLQQIVAENMEGDDVSDWGYVASHWNMSTLAEEIGCSEAEFRLFVEYCDDQLILEKKNGRMFLPLLLERMNEYAKRAYKKNTTDKPKKTDYRDNPDTTDTTEKTDYRDNRDISVSQHNHNTITTQENLTNVKLVDKPPIDDKRDKNIEYLLGLFKQTWGYEPTDRLPRRVAYNFIQIITTYLKKERLREPTPERVQAVLGAYVSYLKTEGWAANIQKLETMKLKFPLFKAAVAEKESHAKADKS